jgi:hypothetical protein
MTKHNHYSLDILDEWVQDSLNSDAEPGEIYDAIVTAIDDNIKYHKACMDASKKLLYMIHRKTNNRRKTDNVVQLKIEENS